MKFAFFLGVVATFVVAGISCTSDPQPELAPIPSIFTCSEWGEKLPVGSWVEVDAVAQYLLVIENEGGEKFTAVNDTLTHPRYDQALLVRAVKEKAVAEVADFVPVRLEGKIKGQVLIAPCEATTDPKIMVLYTGAGRVPRDSEPEGPNPQTLGTFMDERKFLDYLSSTSPRFSTSI